MSESAIIEYVQENAVYLGDDQDEPYSVHYLGNPYWDESPRGLVLQIMQTLNVS